MTCMTCGSEEALNWFNKAIFAYTTVRENGVPLFGKALELDNSTGTEELRSMLVDYPLGNPLSLSHTHIDAHI